MNATAARQGHQLPARVDDATWAALKRLAKRDRRSVSQTVIILLEKALAALGESPQPPPDAG